MSSAPPVLIAAWESAFDLVQIAPVLLLASVSLLLIVLVQRAYKRTAAAETSHGHLAAQIEALLSASRDGIMVQTSDGQIVALNQLASQILGLPLEQALGSSTLELPVTVTDSEGEAMIAASAFGPLTRSEASQVREIVVQLTYPDSSVRDVRIRSTAMPVGDYDTHLTILLLFDLSHEAKMLAELSRSHSQFQVAMHYAPIGIALMNLDWGIVEANQAFAELLGTSAQSLIGVALPGIMHPEDRVAERAQFASVMSGELDRLSIERRFIRADQQVVWLMVDIAMVVDSAGEPEHIMAQFRDATESRLQAEVLTHRAMHDPLSGLANRNLLHEQLREALENPLTRQQVTVLALDLDGFKTVNDRFGHHAGDQLLVHVSQVLRQVTGDRGTVARLGGDEFIILLPELGSEKSVFELAAAIHRGLARPVRIAGQSMVARTSIGIVLPDDELTAEGALALLEAADSALYRAKAQGSGRTEVYDSTMDDKAKSARLLDEIEDAIRGGQIITHYQPIMDLTKRTVSGFEALVRWQHPERGLLLPSDFLSVVHEAGMSTVFGQAIVDEVLAFLHSDSSRNRWVSVNVSADQLGDGTLAARVSNGLGRYRIQPGRLVLELTERSLVVADTRIRHELVELRGAGVPVLLDDFGTGVSPLSYLRDLPVNGVKLDMSFVSGIPQDPSACKVTRALGALARELEMITIAEGIESEPQAQFLAQNGWKYGQGWLFGAAQPEESLRF